MKKKIKDLLDILGMPSDLPRGISGSGLLAFGENPVFQKLDIKTRYQITKFINKLLSIQKDFGSIPEQKVFAELYRKGNTLTPEERIKLTEVRAQIEELGNTQEEEIDDKVVPKLTIEEIQKAEELAAKYNPDKPVESKLSALSVLSIFIDE